jgi:23S rRNA pseudouridine1911/1915/1917 synthase
MSQDYMGGAELFPEQMSAIEVEDDDTFELREGVVLPIEHKMRVDKVLARMAPEFSRNHLQSLITSGEVALDGQVVDAASAKVKVGQRVQLRLVPPAEQLAFRPEPMELNIVYEDEHIRVINKPAGMVVHPAAGNWSGTLLNGLLALDLRAAQLPRAGIIHRLDKDTSGLMVVGNTLEAVTALVRHMAQRSIQRRYLALVHGHTDAKPFTVESPIGRDPVQRTRMAVVGSGKPARTDVIPLAFDPSVSVSAVRCKLHTGRTHQIRVHLSSMGFPLVADAVYGGQKLLGLSRQALHAAELALPHPISGQWLEFRADLPSDMQIAWRSVVTNAQAI